MNLPDKVKPSVMTTFGTLYYKKDELCTIVQDMVTPLMF